MLGIVFQNLTCSNGFKNLIKYDVLFNHFLLCMWGETEVLFINLSTYPFQHSFQVGNVKFVHPYLAA